MDINNIIWAVVWFAILGLGLGILLAVASKIFAVKVDQRIEEITELLPGANCGGCGYSGCSALAQAIVDGKAEPGACNGCSQEDACKIAAIMGVDASKKIRWRAQVMCSGCDGIAKKKYLYSGAKDCVAANRLGGGDMECSFGCLGLGSCVEACKFDALSVENGVAKINTDKCVGCGACVRTCPKHIIRLIEFDSKHWVECNSKDKGALTRKVCDIGCIGCHLCEKNCEVNAIRLEANLAVIDNSLCTGCGKCVEVCPRKIIRTADVKNGKLIIS